MKLTNEQRADIDLCHAFLNALGAAMEGRYAMINMLDTLSGPGSYTVELSEIREQRERVIYFQEEMWRGTPLGFSKEYSEYSADEIEVLELIEHVKQESTARAEIAEQLLEQQDLEYYAQGVILLTTLLGYQAYSRDSYIRGLVRYGECFGPDDLSENWRAHLQSCEESIAVANGFYEILQEEESIDSSLVYQIRESTLLLPAIFRCQVHDINQIFGILAGEFSFDLAEFTSEEDSEWTVCGFSPRAAGYWRAYDLSPQEVVIWLEYGFYQPGLVGAWRYRGFSPEAALKWCNGGYTARQAKFYASLGCNTPDEAEHMQEFSH